MNFSCTDTSILCWKNGNLCWFPTFLFIVLWFFKENLFCWDFILSQFLSFLWLYCGCWKYSEQFRTTVRHRHVSARAFTWCQLHEENQTWFGWNSTATCHGAADSELTAPGGASFIKLALPTYCQLAQLVVESNNPTDCLATTLQGADSCLVQKRAVKLRRCKQIACLVSFALGACPLFCLVPFFVVASINSPITWNKGWIHNQVKLCLCSLMSNLRSRLHTDFAIDAPDFSRFSLGMFVSQPLCFIATRFQKFSLIACPWWRQASESEVYLDPAPVANMQWSFSVLPCSEKSRLHDQKSLPSETLRSKTTLTVISCSPNIKNAELVLRSMTNIFLNLPHLQTKALLFCSAQLDLANSRWIFQQFRCMYAIVCPFSSVQLDIFNPKRTPK